MEEDKVISFETLKEMLKKGEINQYQYDKAMAHDLSMDMFEHLYLDYSCDVWFSCETLRVLWEWGPYQFYNRAMCNKIQKIPYIIFKNDDSNYDLIINNEKNYDLSMMYVHNKDLEEWKKNTNYKNLMTPEPRHGICIIKKISKSKFINTNVSKNEDIEKENNMLKERIKTLEAELEKTISNTSYIKFILGILEKGRSSININDRSSTAIIHKLIEKAGYSLDENTIRKIKASIKKFIDNNPSR